MMRGVVGGTLREMARALPVPPAESVRRADNGKNCIIPRPHCLAESDVSRRAVLRTRWRLPTVGRVRLERTGAPSGRVDSVKHRGGTAPLASSVPFLPPDCPGFRGGAPD